MMLRLQSGQFSRVLKTLEAKLPQFQSANQRRPRAFCLMLIGLAKQRMADYVGARDALEDSWSLWRELGERRGEIGVLNILGQVYNGLDRYAEAEVKLQQALVIAREIRDRAAEATALNDLGEVYRNRNQYSQALACLEQSWEICQKIGNRLGQGRALHNLGALYHVLDRYERSLEHFERALAIWQKVGNRLGAGRTLNGIGSVYRSLGQYPQALESYQQALAIFQKIHDRAGVASVLNNIGQVYSNQSQYREALQQHQQALTEAEKIGKRDLEAIILNNIGSTYTKLGQYAEAERALQQALTLARELQRRELEATTLNNIGSIYVRSGQYAEAEQAHQQALTLAREIGDRANVGRVSSSLAEVYYRQGRYDEALDFCQQALITSEEIGDKAVTTLSLKHLGIVYLELEQLPSALENLQKALAIAREINDRSGIGMVLFNLGLLYEKQNNAATALEYYQEALATFENIRGQIKVEEFVTSFANEQVKFYEQFVNLLWAENRFAEAFHAIERSRSRAFLDQEAASLEDIQRLLDEDTTLVEYFVTERRTLVCAIAKHHFYPLVLDVNRQDLTQKIKAFRRFSNLNNDRPNSLLQLHRALIAPLIPYLKTSKLTIVPHGVLHYLPFAALTDGKRALLDDYTLVALPSASTLRFLPEKRKPNRDTLLALGNPTVDEPGLPSLRFAEQEATTLARLYHTRALLGTAATETAVRRQVGQASILHLAAHGRYNPKNPLFSTLYLAADEKYDGRLEVRKIYELDLTRATNLVVLSACQMQMGQLSRGDEIVALDRAFLYAGTPSVIASLWSVDDAATGLLVKQFYTYLKSGIATAEALRQAQQDVREEYSHPYFWSAFVLTGDRC